MSRTDFKGDAKSKIGSTIEKAEEAVQHSLDRFENAMEHLAEKVEGTSEKLHHVRDVAKDSKDKLMHFKDEVQATIDPLRPYVDQIKDYSARAVTSVRSVPRSYLWIAAGVLGWAAYRLYKSQSTGVTQVQDFNRSEYSSEFPYQ